MEIVDLVGLICTLYERLMNQLVGFCDDCK